MPYSDRDLARAAHRRWRRKNPGKLAKWDRKWKKENPDKAKAIHSRCRAKNAEKYRENRIQKYMEDREKFREKSKKYYHANREAMLQSNKEWRAKNPEKVRAVKLNRRARLSAAGQYRSGVLSAECIAEVKNRQNGRCAACKAKAKLEMDHIMPLALGGGGDKTNFQGLCRSCNLSKHAKHPIDFNRSIGLLL